MTLRQGRVHQQQRERVGAPRAARLDDFAERKLADLLADLIRAECRHLDLAEMSAWD